jgi:hypothetical protein
MLHSKMAGLGRQSGRGLKQALDFLDEGVWIDGLNDDAIEPGVDGAVQLAAVRITGRGDERNILGVRVGAQVFCGVETRDFRQLEVEDD